MEGAGQYQLIDFTQNVQTFGLQSGGMAPQTNAAAQRAGISEKRLPLNVQRQLQSNWCWSAVSVSVSIYYNPQSAWTQCSLVTAEFNTDCCIDGSTSDCNRSWYLDVALTKVGCPNSWTANRTPFPIVMKTINDNTPLCARTQWSNGGGHFLSIIGYVFSGQMQYLFLSDPFYGNQMVPYDVFCTNYQGLGGTWDYSYFTYFAQS